MLSVFIAIICVCLLYLYVKDKRKWGPLDKIPGPKGYPIIGNILDINPDQQKSLDGMYALSQQYNGLFKMDLGPLGRTVLISDPQYFEQILSSTVNLDKGGWYHLVKDWLGRGLALVNGPKWRSSRKLINPIFNTRILNEFCRMFNDLNRKFVDELKSKGNEPFYIHDLVHRNTFLHMYRSLIDNEILDDKKTEMRVQTYLSSTTFIIQTAINRFFSIKVFDWIFNLSKDHSKLHDALRTVRGLVSDIMKERRFARSKTDGKTFLDILLDIQDKHPDIPDIEIIHQIDTFMFAGQDTVAAALNFAIFELSCNKDIQDKLYSESIEIYGHDLSTELTLTQLENAEYLDKFCKETLRKYPSAPMIARQLTEPLNFAGVDIPVGTIVMILIYCMQRTAKYYPDPLKFDPERFSLKNKSAMSEYAHSPFSHGLRNCIGQRFALMEMKSTITKLVRHFIISKGDPNFEVTVGQAGILIPLNGVFVKLQERI